MQDIDKTKEDLIEELGVMRQRVSELETQASRPMQQESEERFVKAFLQNSVPMAICTIKEGRYIDVSDAFLELMGLEREEVIGNTSTAIGFITPEQRELALEGFARNGRVTNLELQVRTKEGEIRHGLFNSSKIRIADEEYLLTVATDITRQKKVEESLLKSQEVFRLMTNNLPGAVYQFYARPDGDMGLYYFSERASEMLGISSEPEWFFRLFVDCVAPDDRDDFLESIRTAIRTFSTWDHEVRFIKPTGEEIYIRGISQPRRHGDEIVFDGVLLDITSRKLAEMALKESEARFRDLAENTPDCIWETDSRLRITYCSGAIADMIGYSPGEMIGKSPLELVSPDEFQRMNQEFHQVMKIAGPFCFVDTIIHKDGSHRVVETRGVPVYSSHGEHTGFRGVSRDITERSRLEETLKQANAYNRNLIEASLDPLVTIGENGTITDVNRATEIATGHSREELIGTDFSEYFTDPGKAREGFQEVFHKGQVRDYELGLRHCNGHITSVGYNASIIRDASGRATGVFAAVRDISARKMAEERLLFSEKKFSAAFHESPAPMVITDPIDGTIIDVNRACEEWSGHKREDAIGKTTVRLGILKVEQRDAVYREIGRNGTVDFMEMRYTVKDGQVRDILHSARFIEFDNKPRLLSYILDITEQRRAEKDLRDRQARIDSIFRAAPAGIGVIVNRVITDVNDRICEMTGYSREELVGSRADMLYPTIEEFERVGIEKYRQIDHRGIGSVETRWKRKDGRVLDILLTSAPIVPGDLSLGVTFTSLDITRRKRAEEALRESEAKFRFLTEKMNDIVWTTDMDFRLTYDSPSVEKVLGFTPEERMQQKASEMLTPESYAKILGVFAEELARDKEEGVDPDRAIKLELEYYHKNGTTVWMECIASAIRDSAGNPVGIYGVSRDITDRKRVEEELKRHKDRLEELVRERTAELSQAYNLLKIENEARKISQKELRAREVDLEKGRREQEEMNAALKVLLKQREEDRLGMEMNIVSNLKTSVLPYLDRLVGSGLEEYQVRLLSMLRSLLEDIVSPFIRNVSSEYLGLTPSEIQVASLIKEGKSSKEIAKILNVSLNTVHTYRYKIRIKTGLKNNKVNLRSYLQTLG